MVSVSYLALSVIAGSHAATQTATVAQQPAASALPPVEVDEPKRKPRRKTAKPAARSEPAVTQRQASPAQADKPPAPADTQEARTGTVGVYSNSTAVATKTNTPLINIPQSITVVTRDFIREQNPQGLTDVTRYIPGVAVHQGEGNRDELVIRGVDSSANFFVNGFRDDVQFYRDLYNTQSVEVLRGPSALTFGRGSGGGLLNRTLKEADGTRVYEVTAQTGSWANRRVTVDAGQAVTENFAARLNAVYEASDSFRDYVNMERYGINPTFTWKLGDATKVQLSYEYFHDDRVADRGNPSQAVTGGGPARPFAPGGSISTFFGSPSLNDARVNVQSVMAVVDHDFQNGLTVKNSARYADYQKFYQNVYPGGAVNAAASSVALSAYHHTTDRTNLINQTDFVYKGFTGPVSHTVAFDTEFGRQYGIDVRDTGLFNGATSVTVNPFNPTWFGPVTFAHLATDGNSRYGLNTESAYARDTVELTRWLQLIGGARFDRFDLSAVDLNTNTRRGRIDDKVSPQAAVVFKPVDNLSIYGAYSISYLPASGDQFSSLNNGTVLLDPQKFENKEVGIKWNPLKRLQYTAAVYELKRTNVPIADPNNPGFFFPSGSHLIRGFETALTGYITDDWQTSFGYAYTDARITSATSATITAGKRVQLVPYHQFAWWNRYQINPVFAASLGVIYYSDSYASSDDTVSLPGWVRVDAGLYAKINETWKAQLNVENVFNQTYWASADGNNNLSPGQPRTFKLMATARF
ncbi:MAG: TonB-dependent siderophore receptor [Pseudolabrys sp.]